MTDSHLFASVETLLVAWLPTVTGGASCSAELPDNFENPAHPEYMIPVNYIERISGGNYDANPYVDRPIVDVDTYGASRVQAQTLAELTRNVMFFKLPGLVLSGNVFIKTRTVTGPRQLAHPNPAVRRYAATYELTLHPQ